MISKVNFEKGKLEIAATQSVDTDHDGKSAAEVSILVKLDAAEVVSEIAKKDLPWLEALISQIKG